jgi:endogenous inhibitor of DNA gyrase (YacG/DUF329 family)
VNAPSRKPAKPKTSARCPICGKHTVQEHRPFCSKRCAEIDLGRWLKGGYAVPGARLGKIGEPDDEQE